MASSIYQKACPSCAATVLVSATECECGHWFASTDATDVPDEELFLAYLAARVDQALAELRSRQAELTKNPGDFSCMSKVMRAVRESQAARNEVESHQRQFTTLHNTGINDTGMTSVATQSTQPTAEFRRRQAAKAAQIVESGYVTGAKACPRCRVPAPPSTVRCQCGHFFQVEPPLPASALVGKQLKNAARHSISDPNDTPKPNRRPTAPDRRHR